MPKRLYSDQPRSELSAEQKVGFLLLMILGVGGLVLGFRSMHSSLYRPFEEQVMQYAGQDFLTSSQAEEKQKEEQKKVDTDGDTLSDYDELYVFKTSPYLSDTDSDGYSDDVEVFSSNDPNCPMGSDCSAASAEAAADGTVDTTAMLEGVGVDVDQVESLQTKEEIMAYFTNMTTEQIRQMLVDSGVPQEKVDTLSDEEIKSLFDSSLAEAVASGALDQTQTQTTE